MEIQHQKKLENGNERMPLISVVLSVYNGEETLQKALDSIWGQTISDFELIVVNDGSTDRTPLILSQIRDPRLRVVHQANSGLAPSLNAAIRLSRGRYIARIDADDEAMPERFAFQVDFLDRNPNVAVVGCDVVMVYPDGKNRIRRRPKTPQSIRKNIIRINPIVHSSAMIRRDILNEIGLYDESKDGAKQTLVEDYDLWARIIAAGYDLANLDAVLMKYHVLDGSILRKKGVARRLRQQVLSRLEIIKILGLPFSAYMDIPLVVIVSLLQFSGLRIDKIFNFLARGKESKKFTPAK